MLLELLDRSLLQRFPLDWHVPVLSLEGVEIVNQNILVVDRVVYAPFARDKPLDRIDLCSCTYEVLLGIVHLWSRWIDS